jgi:hypothetical protein
MPNFAVLEIDETVEIQPDMVGDPYIVVNYITAESLEMAEEITGKKCVEYNNPHRIDIGYNYNEQFDIFIPKQPYDDWVLDGTLWKWVPPVPRPRGEDGLWIENLEWNQETKQWVEILPQE